MNIKKRLGIAGSQLVKGNFGNAFKSAINSNQAAVIASFSNSSYRGLPSNNGKSWWFGGNGNEIHFSFNSNQDAVNAYTKCSPLNSIINKKAQAHINGLISIVDKEGNEVDNEKVKKIKELMAKPNPLQSQQQFEAQQYIYCQLFGYCPVLQMKPIGFDKPEHTYQMWNIPASMLDIEEVFGLFYNHTDKPFKSIKLTYNGEESELAIENIFFIKDFSPSFSTMFLPESRIKPLSMEVNNIIGAYESRNVLINYRGALGILSNDAKDAMGTLPVKKEDKQALQDDFLRYGLSKSQWKFIITSASVKWQQIGVPTKDLMLFEEIEDDIMRICDIYGYQYELLSSTKGVTFANKNEAKKILYQDTIIPESISICEQQTKLFGLDLLGLKLKKDFSHIPALQEDDVKKSTARLLLNQAKKIEYEAGLITLNNWLQSIGEMPIGEAGDVRATDVKDTNIPLATIIGVGGVQSLVGVLQASGLSDEARSNTLQILFGISPENASLMTTGNNQQNQNNAN